MKKAADGWQVNVIASFQSGQPLTLFSNDDNSLQGNSLDRPNDPTAFDWAFNEDGHLAPGSLASFGDIARNIIRGPGINNWDIFFMKDTKIGESKSVEFRAEFFNAFNHAQFLNPDNQGFSGTFGQISQTRGPLLIQFALKFYF